MNISKVHKLEQAVVLLLNFDGWELQWCGEDNLPYDAKGKTPKGIECVIEMKFRKKYYETKMLEKDKYENLMSLDEDIVKIYFVSDPKANYYFWLNTITMPEQDKKYCPSTTLWNSRKQTKEVYLLQESQATIIDHNEPN